MPSRGMRTNLLHLTTRKEWRRWLEKHYKTEPEVWLVSFRKGTGKPRIPYNDAVEEALCFGWIDSTLRRIDDERFAQRFSPRRPGSGYSQMNIERLRELVARKMVRPEVLATLPDLSDQAFRLPDDILQAIREDVEAWRNFRRFSKRYQRIRIGFIEAARNRPAEFEKRLRHFVRMTAKNKQYGFGGIESYYEDADDRGS